MRTGKFARDLKLRTTFSVSRENMFYLNVFLKALGQTGIDMQSF